MSAMPWELIAITVIGLVVLKFIFKPIFKLLALIALALAAWWLWKGGF